MRNCRSCNKYLCQLQMDGTYRHKCKNDENGTGINAFYICKEYIEVSKSNGKGSR